MKKGRIQLKRFGMLNEFDNWLKTESEQYVSDLRVGDRVRVIDSRNRYVYSRDGSEGVVTGFTYSNNVEVRFDKLTTAQNVPVQYDIFRENLESIH